VWVASDRLASVRAASLNRYLLVVYMDRRRAVPFSVMAMSVAPISGIDWEGWVNAAVRSWVSEYEWIEVVRDPERGRLTIFVNGEPVAVVTVRPPSA